ncbi:MAG: Ig-like domain-containing protein [Blautia sp.]|nr:Ig-like domain-containing protein [Blautia sp.]
MALEAASEPFLGVSETASLSAQVTGVSQKVKWSSSNTSVASVSSKSVVKGKKKGTAIITAKANKVTATCKVKVLEEYKAIYLKHLKDNASQKYLFYYVLNVDQRDWRRLDHGLYD